jgi:glycerol-3-phosphate acyltransferase PlsY
MEYWKILAVIIASYLLGSVNVAIIITKLFMRKDVRKYGSHNAGATNVARSFGLPLGIATLVGDFGKTILSMLIGKWLLDDNGSVLAAAACLLGHCFPIYFHFKGGKGVATAGCIALMLDWRLFAILVCVFLVVACATRFVSLASICCAVAYPISQFILKQPIMWNVVLGVFIMLLVIFMHRENIKRLLNHTEAKFSTKKKNIDKE